MSLCKQLCAIDCGRQINHPDKQDKIAPNYTHLTKLGSSKTTVAITKSWWFGHGHKALAKRQVEGFVTIQRHIPLLQ